MTTRTKPRPTAHGATQILAPVSYQWADFPIPGHAGRLDAAFLNRDLGVGPIMAVLKMAAGSRIPAHYHERTTETFVVLDGSFINAGETHGAGSFFAVQPGDIHGPHETTTGCTLLFVQAVEVDPTDFHIAE